MKQLTRILHDLDQGNITSDDAENRILSLLNDTAKPSAFEKNNLPLNVRYAFCEAVEMYQNIQVYEMGIIKKTEFISRTLEIKDKYKKKP